ncbi:MAG: sialidase [Kiritimatiellae bacterium]|nr:sialidase [Kiritimatiellia bacterium]
MRVRKEIMAGNFNDWSSNIAACVLCVLFSPYLLLASGSNAQSAGQSCAAWDKVKPYFNPPAEFAGKFGSYASPLKFYDGRQVESRGEWGKRRGEILERWHALMGEWPPLLVDQKLTVLESEQLESYTRHKVEFNWLPNEKTYGYLLVPAGGGVRPAAITVFYDPETAVGLEAKHPHRDYALQLVQRGFVALSLGTRDATARKEFSLYYPTIENATVQPLSMLAYAAANAWHVLAKVEGVDSKRIAIAGHSFGGKWAMFASCLFDKFACGVWSDPGIVFSEERPSINYWEPWYLGYHPKPWRQRGLITESNPSQGLYMQLREKGLDLTDLHALMAPRPFMVSGGSEDPQERWIALNHAVRVNDLLGFKHRVAMTNRPLHSPDAEAMQQVCDFLEYALMPSLAEEDR